VVVASSDLLELVGLCHRVVVMRQGRNVAELAGAEMTEQNMVACASGVEA
jgi:ribose transport system ATP-binding protein